MKRAEHTARLTGAKVFQHGEEWPGQKADILFQGGHIAEISPHLAPSSAEHTVKLPGGVLIPAFFDAHLHLDQGGRYLGMLALRDIQSSSAVLDAVSKATAEKSSGWLIGIGLREMAWPSIEDFHRVSRGRPCLLYTRDYHTAIVNLEAIELLGLTAQTVLPEGGWIELDDDGNPNGVLHENAVMWAENQLPPESVEEQRNNLLRAQDYLRKLGVLGVSDTSYPNSWPILKAMHEEELLELSVEQWSRCLDFTPGCIASERFHSDRLLRHRIKLFIDGALGSRTGWMKQEYSDKPGWTSGPVPDLTIFDHFLDQAVESGWSLAVHAIGDAGVEHVVKALSALPRTEVPYRVEHVQHSDPETIHFLGDSNLVSSVQPLHRIEDAAMLMERIGQERADWAFPIGSLMNDQGTNLVLGSDWPVVSPDPRLTMGATLQKRNRGEGMVGEELTVEQALRAYSLCAAEVAGFNGIGDLLPGYEASLLWLPVDPGRDAAAWGELSIGAIWHRGELIHQTVDF